MKTRKFALCLAAVFLVMIYINIQRNHTFTLSDDEGTIKTQGVTERIKLERGKWYKVVGRGNLTLNPVNIRVE